MRLLILHVDRFAYTVAAPTRSALREPVSVPTHEVPEALLVSAGFEVHRSPFGWFTRWDLQAKGHPLSRVARLVRAGDDGAHGGYKST